MKDLIKYVNASHSVFHGISNVEQKLIHLGYHEIKIDEINKFNKFYLKQNDSSIVAVNRGKDNYLNITISHIDYPQLKLKPNPIINLEYTKFDIEPYGSTIYSSWFDRPLSIAGRVTYLENQKLVTKLIDIDQDLIYIPSLAIHLNRDVNQGFAYNPEIDLKPMLGNQAITLGDLLKIKDIKGFDLYVYNREKPALIGLNQEFIASPHLDNLISVYAATESFIKTEAKGINILAIFDNEEIGSNSYQGAQSSFLNQIVDKLEYEKNNSMIISLDNAHASHPNHMEKNNSNHQIFMNKGVVLKYNANGNYITNGVTAAIFKTLCENEAINYQEHAFRADLKPGSTLGMIVSTKLGIQGIDIGVSQLAMHSAYELAGVSDIKDLIKILTEFYCK